MKLIIDIPENVVIAIQNGKDYRYDIHTTIAQGIPYEERPHGKWQECENTLYTGGGYTKCSNCGMKYSWGGYHEVFEFAYCPTCGANMRTKN